MVGEQFRTIFPKSFYKEKFKEYYYHEMGFLALQLAVAQPLQKLKYF